MWDFLVFGIEFYRIFYCFFIYCLVGWIWECCYCSIVEGKLINRGFLNGPVIPIYGCAATFIFMAFYNPFMAALTGDNSFKSFAIIYFLGALIASALEFITSYSMEKLFHAKWWDYSHLPCNIQGRVCLFSSLFWGFAAVFLVKVLHPLVLGLIDFFPRNAGEISGIVIFILFMIDLLSTIIVTIHLDKKITYIQKLRKEFFDFTDKMKSYEINLRTDFKDKFGETPVGEAVDLGLNRMDAQIAFTNQAISEKKAAKEDKRKKRINKIDNALGTNKVRMSTAAAEVKRRLDVLQTTAKERFNDVVASNIMEFGRQSKGFMEKSKTVVLNGFQRFTLKRLLRAFPWMSAKGDRQGAILDAKEQTTKKDK